MNIFKRFFKKVTPCIHEGDLAEIRQVRVENGRLVGFKIRTPELLECKKCGATKRTMI
jgi:hypothetical protein